MFLSQICPEDTGMLKDGQNNETIEYTKTSYQLMINDIREYNLLVILYNVYHFSTNLCLNCLNIGTIFM